MLRYKVGPHTTKDGANTFVFPLFLRVGGFLYIVATATCSLVYLDILAPCISNDLWWPDFNTTGVQTFLGDLYNAKLATGSKGTLDMFGPGATIAKDYSHGTAFVSMRPTTARAMLLNRLPLAQAIHLIRSISFFDNMRTLPPPCWFDFNRTYEMAHTARHQVVCNQRRVANAAFYLEVLLRNLRLSDLTSNTYYPEIQSAIFAAIQSTSSGEQYIHSLLNHAWPTVSDEVNLWSSHGLLYFQNLMQNLYQEGIQDTITIVNALGLRQTITISNIPYSNRPKAAWTTQFAFAGFWNDLDSAAQTGSSLIRSAPNSFEMMGNDWDMYYDGPAGTEATALIRTNLGPLTVIDIFLLQPPPSLLFVADMYQNMLHTAILASPKAYATLDEPIVDVTPVAWRQPNAVYYGGNPVCSYGNPQPYVQPSFSYYDDCGVQVQHTIPLARESVIFAMVATGVQSSQALASICEGLCSPRTHATCLQTLQHTFTFFQNLLGPTLPRLNTTLQVATQDILPLKIGFVQWATINSTDQVLTQPMVASPYADPWSFIGWMTMLEWANGQREVYSFEGDSGNWTLVSRLVDFQPLAADIQELPHNACTYLRVVCIYVSAVFVLVNMLVLVFSALAQFQIDGRNLFKCNRLVGGAWIGRPFLYLRGLTAIFVLSTSSVVFNRYEDLAKLDFSPRPFWHVFVLAGEATWITIVNSDVCLPLTQPYGSLYAPISAHVAWLAVFTLEVLYPYRAEATIGRSCTIVSFMRGVECVSGEVAIGSVDRAMLLFAVVVGSGVLIFPLVRLASSWSPRFRPKERAHPHVLLTSAADAYLSRHELHETYFDAAACVMCGILPLRKRLFDTKLWVFFQAPCVGRMMYSLPLVTLGSAKTSLSPQTAILNRASATKKVKSNFRIRAVGLLGLGYMACGVVSSFLYLAVSKESLANDFFWLGFNDTNTQSFLTNWFNRNLQFLRPTPQMQIDNANNSYYTGANNASQVNILSSALYAIAIQDEVNSLENVVQGLRTMDSCNLPWIATAYCFADFNQQWPMAYSAHRQNRCEAEDNNGAVYLEAVLRNANWAELSKCWGDALEIAVFSAVRGTNTGNGWIESVKTNALSVADEVAFWRNHNITRFTTQWQNYKKLGVTEMFLVSNALGVDYPLTLKKSNSSFQLTAATSFKMYWSFANDLTQVTKNASGTSLLQQSSTFLYANTTLQAVMLQGSTVLTSPLDPALALFNGVVGPFGVVDLKRVPIPQLLGDLYHSMSQFIMTKLSSSDVIQRAFWSIYVLAFFTPQPQAWDNLNLWGGDINCGRNYGGSFSTPFQFFSSNGLCGNYLTEYTSPYTQNVIMAIITSVNMSAATQLAISNRDVTHKKAVAALLNQSVDFLTRFFTPTEKSQYYGTSQDVQSLVRDQVKLELVHYLTYDNVNYNMSRVNVFARTEPDFAFFSWLYLFEWVEGKREVVSFQGDLDTITTLSTIQNFDERPVNQQEIPVNVSFYFLTLIQYITAVLFGVGCLVCFYILTSRGFIEGSNMVGFGLVAGHVWIGRPLVLLRGLTAIALLSTSSLHLIEPRTGLLAQFSSPPRFWLTTVLSCSEMTWLVNVIVDTFSVATHKYTDGYSTLSTVAVVAEAALWSFVAPTSHLVSVGRACTLVAVDFDVVCTSGRVEIGDFTRFQRLVALGFGMSVFCYVAERVRYPKGQTHVDELSLWLYCTAKYTFERSIRSSWEHEGVCYIDQASAALTGILTLHYGGKLYIFDIKTWRVYAMPPKKLLAAMNGHTTSHLVHALPLVE
ncbi:Aste57867_10456 [Aphanomyces stellatus]|uniref:Aste57867_10456 protein n=1 Tax=Aphanomyces stellatus TaxID=120398 RepID=A0A485KQX6_9STRA|nr:hypothetical protein As57867_010416 [Aphanomyces stellatus]VFT87330.1 Aste57867_10456 [Aphanomyces stellatus]